MEYKERIKRAFSKGAPFYDEYAYIQMEVASRLIDRVKRGNSSSILELGCGSGNYTLMLREAFPHAKIMAVDLAPGMIEIASRRLNGQGIVLLLADGEGFFIKERFDLVTSNVAFQWFGNLEGAIKEYRSLLKKKGKLYFSIFGPGTFCELKETTRQLFPGMEFPTDHFLKRDAIEGVLRDSFKGVEVEEVIFTEGYRNLRELLKTIKYTGGNGLGGGAGLFFTLARIRRLQDAYIERFGTIKATYQSFFCMGIK